MSIFDIVSEDGKVFSVDCIESFGYRDAGSLTEYTIESGAKVSDHYVLENKEVSVGFVITDIKTAGSYNPLSTDDFINGINELRESKVPFKFYWREESGRLDKAFNNLMFTDASFNQDSTNGYATGSYSYKGSFTMKQITFADRAVISQQRVPALKGTGSANKTSNVSTGKFSGFPKSSPLLVKPPPVPTISSDPSLEMLKSEVSRMKRGDG